MYGNRPGGASSPFKAKSLFEKVPLLGVTAFLPLSWIQHLLELQSFQFLNENQYQEGSIQNPSGKVRTPVFFQR